MNGNYNSLCSIHISTHNLTFMKTWSLFWMCHSQHQAYTWFTEWSSMGNVLLYKRILKYYWGWRGIQKLGWSWTRPILNILQMQKCHIGIDNWLENRHSFKVRQNILHLKSSWVPSGYLNYSCSTLQFAMLGPWHPPALWQWHIIKNCNLVVL